MASAIRMASRTVRLKANRMMNNKASNPANATANSWRKTPISKARVVDRRLAASAANRASRVGEAKDRTAHNRLETISGKMASSKVKAKARGNRTRRITTRARAAETFSIAAG